MLGCLFDPPPYVGGWLVLSRREFLTASSLLLPILLRGGTALAEQQSRHVGTYHVDADVLFGIFSFNLDGSFDEVIDRAAGRYRVSVVGQGSQVVSRLKSVGLIRGRRFVPTTTLLFLDLRGRESRTAISYDHERGLIDYSHVSYTFFLGRKREVHDVVRSHPDQHVDDVVTAALNYAEGALQRDGTGAFWTHMVRRTLPEGEGPDDVRLSGYRAEIVPLRFRVVQDPVDGRDVAQLDLTRLSSWARRGAPARVVFGPDWRPESIRADLILGTTVRVTFRPMA